MKKRNKVMKKYFKKYTGKENALATEYIESDIDAALVRAKRLTNIKEEDFSEPLVISAPASFKQDSKVKYRITVNKEGNHVDYDQALITSIFLSNEALYYHETMVDHMTGKVSYDIAGELNLFDILHMETVVEYDEFKDHKTYRAYLKLNLVDGNNISLHLKEHFMYDGYIAEDLLSEDEENIVKTIKQAVRLSK